MSRITARRREFLNSDPFRAPDTRWLEAVAEVDGHDADSPQARLRRREPETRRAIAYLKAAGQVHFPEDPPRRILRHYGAIWSSHGLYERGGLLRAQVEARILAKQSFADIAAATGVEEDALRAFESLHYQVLDRLGAKFWIGAMVIGPEFLMGRWNQDPGTLWKAYAYAGGPNLLDLAMTLTGHRPPTHPPELIAKLRVLLLGMVLPVMPLGQEIRLRAILDRHFRKDSPEMSQELLARLREDVDFGPLLAQFSLCSPTG